MFLSKESHQVGQNWQSHQTNNKNRPSIFSLFSNVKRLACQSPYLSAAETLVHSLAGYQVTFQSRDSNNEESEENGASEQHTAESTTDQRESTSNEKDEVWINVSESDCSHNMR